MRLHAAGGQQREPTAAAEPAAPTPGRGALPAEVRARMERSFGADFSNVRIHEGDHVTALGAHAYTHGDDIHFGPGRYDPASHAGVELLGHELAHVVQQRQGRVRATRQLAGAELNDADDLEREADEWGARAARGEPVAGASGASGASAASSGGPVQRMVIYPGRIGTMDALIATQLAIQHRMAGGATLTLDELLAAPKHTYRIRPREPVVIIGHGAAGAVEGQRAEIVARALLAIEHIDQALFILFTSCNAAVDQREQGGTSVVDITQWVLEKARLSTRVVGAPGALVNDLRRRTGDAVTHVLPGSVERAGVIQRLIGSLMKVPDVNAPGGFESLGSAEAFGRRQLRTPPRHETRRRRFHDRLVRVLSGRERSIDRALASCEAALSGLYGDPPTMVDWVLAWYHEDVAQRGPLDQTAWCAAAGEFVCEARSHLIDLETDGALIAVGDADRRLVTKDVTGTASTSYDALADEAKPYALFGALPSDVGSSAQASPKSATSSHPS